MTDKKIPITKSTRNTAPLTFAERGLLAYMLDNLNPQGQFHQPLQKAADENGSTRPTVHRLTQGLIQKHAVRVASPAFRGSDGWMVPPVLIPIPQVEQVTKYPVPNGTQNQTVLETGTSTVLKREMAIRTVVEMERGLQRTRSTQPIPPVERVSLQIDESAPTKRQALQNKIAEIEAARAQTIAECGDDGGWGSTLTKLQSELSKVIASEAGKAGLRECE